MSAGHVPIVPVSAMRKASSASDGIVWIKPTAPRTICSDFGGFGEALPFQLRRRVHADHAPLVDPAFERLERAPGFGKALRYLEPVEEHRLVARKVFPVVLQHAQGVALDLRVGGIDVHDVYPAGGDRLVG